ncbi:hypothetical protein Tco_0529594 [Tanacetum coccineum]
MSSSSSLIRPTEYGPEFTMATFAARTIALEHNTILARTITKNLPVERGDGVAGIKRRRRDLSSDGVRNLATTSGRGRLKEDLESST